MSTPINEPLLGGNGGGGGSGTQTPTGTSQGHFSPGTLTRTSSWGGGALLPGGGDEGAPPSSSAGGGGGFNSGTGPGYYTRLESLARRKPGQPVRESARARRTTWTVIDATGRRTSVVSDKRGIIQRFKLGIPIRDMRLMDASGALLAAAAAAGGAPAPAAGAAPLTPDAAVIVVRDNAILVRMEHVRAIITANVVLIPSPETSLAMAAGAAGLPLSAEAAAADAAAARFVAALRDAIVEAAAEARAHAARYMSGAGSGGGGLGAFNAAARQQQAGPTSPTQQQQQQQQQQQGSSSMSTSPSHPNTAAAGTPGGHHGLPPPHPPHPPPPPPGSIADSENEHEVAPLPFELAVLEAALRETATNQARMVAELEAVLSPALDTLTKTVSQPALERVRKLKTRHQRLLTRVQSVREELQRFLDDDEDMFRMCLTRKLELEELERERACAAASAAAAATAAAESADAAAAAAGRANSGFPQAPSGPAPHPPSATTTAPISVAAPWPGAVAPQVPQSLYVGTPGTGGGFAFTRRPSVAFARPAFSSAISSLTSAAAAAAAFPQPLVSAEQAAAAEAAAAAAAAEEEENSEALETVENLLESYFMTVDGAFDRLVALDEFVQDTEEYINIELDSARNRLIRLDIVITAGSFAVAIFSLVAGVLGENVDIPKRIVDAGFGVINIVMMVFAVSTFAGVMAYIRYRRLF